MKNKDKNIFRHSYLSYCHLIRIWWWNWWEIYFIYLQHLLKLPYYSKEIKSSKYFICHF